MASGTLTFNSSGQLSSVTPTGGTATSPTAGIGFSIPPVATPPATQTTLADGAATIGLTWNLETAGAPTITQTAAGEPSSLAETALPPADAVMQLAAPRSRHRLLTEFLDASITDELQPDRDRDTEFDLYDPANPNQPPYSADFLAAYREQQRKRNRRITAYAQQKLRDFRNAGKPHAEHSFVVHGTMADPRWLDPTIEPNGRRPRWSYLGDPEVANTSPGALMRFTTARSWLSQWRDVANAMDRLTAQLRGPRA